MNFVCCQIDLVEAFLLILLHKDAHFLKPPPPADAGLHDLLTIYSQGHNQKVSLCMPNGVWT